MEQAPRIGRAVEQAPRIGRAVEQAPRIGRWLSIAEKLLASRQIEVDGTSVISSNRDPFKPEDYYG